MRRLLLSLMFCTGVIASQGQSNNSDPLKEADPTLGPGSSTIEEQRKSEIPGTIRRVEQEGYPSLVEDDEPSDFSTTSDSVSVVIPPSPGPANAGASEQGRLDEELEVIQADTLQTLPGAGQNNHTLDQEN